MHLSLETKNPYIDIKQYCCELNDAKKQVPKWKQTYNVFVMFVSVLWRLETIFKNCVSRLTIFFAFVKYKKYL